MAKLTRLLRAEISLVNNLFLHPHIINVFITPFCRLNIQNNQRKLFIRV